MNDEEDRKLFVGGLPQDCTQDEIKVNVSIAVLWIRIRIHLAVLYPDPYWKMQFRIQEHEN
jgi:hypothetical protein